MALGKGFAAKHTIFYHLRNVVATLFLYYLRFWAKVALQQSSATVVGIAGAVGKSTTRQALAAITSSRLQLSVVEGNSETGIPLGILGFDHHTYHLLFYLKVLVNAPFRIRRLRQIDTLIVEMGIDGPFKPKNMAYLLTIVKPHCAILLSESLAHSQQYEAIIPPNIRKADIQTQEEFLIQYQREDDAKILQTSTLGAAIIDATDTALYNYVQNIVPKGRLYTAGWEDHHDATIHYYEVTTQGTRFDFSVHTHQQKEFLSFFFPGVALPKQSGGAFGAAIIAAIHLGIPVKDIQKNLVSGMQFPKSRAALYQGLNNTILYDSSYNASPHSVLAGLEVLKQIKKKEKKKIICVLGDMKELGTFTEAGHLAVAKALPDTADQVLLVGPLAKRYILPYVDKHKQKFTAALWFQNIHELVSYLQRNLPSGAVVYFKGSQNLEEAIKPLLLHEEDNAKLCRQEPFWEESKKKNGVWVNTTSGIS